MQSSLLVFRHVQEINSTTVKSLNDTKFLLTLPFKGVFAKNAFQFELTSF